MIPVAEFKQRVIAVGGNGIISKSALNIRDGGGVFEKVLSEKSYRCAVEIGTCKGMTALVLSRFFDEVVSIDIVDDGDREAIASYCGVRNIRFVTVANNEEKAAVINGLTFDGAYVDGDHARDTVTDFALVKRCGQVLFHEYWPAQPPVWNLVNSLGTVVTHGKLALWKS